MAVKKYDLSTELVEGLQRFCGNEEKRLHREKVGKKMSITERQILRKEVALT
jgi:hypothetical protein